MKTFRIYLIVFTLICITFTQTHAQQKTYCNPVNIDYGYAPYKAYVNCGKHRTTADPAIVNYKGDYYLFATNQQGYWISSDMLNWKYMARKFIRPWNNAITGLNAPAVDVMGDTMIVFGSTYSTNFTIWMSTNPKANIWKPLVDSLEIGGWDPDFFTDDNGKLYMYNGSSNAYPIYGIEFNRHTMQPIGTRKEMYILQPWRYGWQRFGENMDNNFMQPFIEGPWMTEHDGKYYLQYGAPGTQFSGYADGVVVGDNPLGPFTPQSDPVSFKPGGFICGAGHGSTFKDNQGKYWHVSTMVISVKNIFERRIGIWPAGFDKDGIMYCNTSFGDYPHYLPSSTPLSKKNGMRSGFTGWMLLNYDKPVTVSSTLGDYNANNAVDESIKTYWSAATGNKGEWIESSLGNISTVKAVQINYADQDAQFMMKQTGIYIQYQLYYSIDGRNWKMLIDKSKNKTDVPHDYVELKKPVKAKYIKLVNIHMPTGKFAISGLRVFGNGRGSKPDTVKNFGVFREERDKRNAYFRWCPMDNAYAYNIYYGTAPDKLYNCIMVYKSNRYWFRGLDKEETYYFTIEAVNENGVSPQTTVLRVE